MITYQNIAYMMITPQYRHYKNETILIIIHLTVIKYLNIAFLYVIL